MKDAAKIRKLARIEERLDVATEALDAALNLIALGAGLDEL